jgi:3-oxoacyl-[acyl-carrier protein] reductase
MSKVSKLLLTATTEGENNVDCEGIGKIIDQIPIGRLIEPEEVVALVAELYRNEAMAGETVFIHGGLRLGSKG